MNPQHPGSGDDLLPRRLKAQLKDGHLGNICLVSGLDNERRNGSIAYYLSEPVVADDSKGVGPFMMAYSEYLRG